MGTAQDEDATRLLRHVRRQIGIAAALRDPARLLQPFASDVELPGPASPLTLVEP